MKAIFSVSIPESYGNVSTAQSQAIEHIKKLADKSAGTREGLVLLGRYVWLIHLDRNLPFFSDLIKSAEASRLPYRVLYLQDEQVFDEYGTAMSNNQ